MIPTRDTDIILSDRKISFFYRTLDSRKIVFISLSIFLSLPRYVISFIGRNQVYSTNFSVTEIRPTILRTYRIRKIEKICDEYKYFTDPFWLEDLLELERHSKREFIERARFSIDSEVWTAAVKKNILWHVLFNLSDKPRTS